MALLTGFAIPLQGNLPGDHTYVESDDGFNWPCWGRNSGGQPICDGYGSSATANCISHPNSQAGIIYGITGVCHQTANRILNPAGKLVSRARGYAASIFLFGTYGTDIRAWRARQQRCSASGSGGVFAHQEKDDGDRAYLARVNRLYGDMRPQREALHPHVVTEFLAAEMTIFLQYRIGTERTSYIIEDLHRFQLETLETKAPLDRAVELGQIDGLEYGDRVNLLATELAHRIGDRLRSEEYEQVFGQRFDMPVTVVEPEIADEVYRKPRRW